MKISSLLFAVYLLSAWTSAESQTAAVPDDRVSLELDSYFGSLFPSEQFSGVVLVARSGEILQLREYGMSDFEQQTPTLPWNRYEIASLSKPFTAAAISLLNDRGALDLDDPVTGHIPRFPHQGVTIRHLLLHQSGLADPDYESLGPDELTPEELVIHIGSKELLFEPGTKSQYSNAGYNALARIIEVASGSSFDSFLREEIFLPLGMRSTGVFGMRQIVPFRADGYVHDDEGTLVNATPTNISLSHGSGSLSSTALDLLKWAEAVRTKRLHDVYRWEWPFGWGKIREPLTGIDQSGLTSGYSSSVQILDEPEIVIVILSNIESGEWTSWGREVRRIVLESLSVDDIDEIESRLDGAEVVIPRRTTDYGATEIFVREPSGHIVGFAQHQK